MAGKHPFEDKEDPFEGFVPLDPKLEKALQKKVDESVCLFQDPEECQAAMYVLELLKKGGKKQITGKEVYGDGVPLNRHSLILFSDLYQISLKYIKEKGGLEYLVKKGLKI
jgi:hypothetical protein